MVGNVEVYEPCPYPKVYKPDGTLMYEHVEACPKCIELKRRWYSRVFDSHIWNKEKECCVRCGATVNEGKCVTDHQERLSFKEMEDKMQDQYNGGKLTAREIVEAQLAVENEFNMLVAEMDQQKLEDFYNDILRKMEMFRVRALRFRQLKTDHEIKELSRVPEQDREEYKRQLKERATHTTVAAVRRSKTEKMIESFAKKLKESNPNISIEEATERAKKLFA